MQPRSLFDLTTLSDIPMERIRNRYSQLVSVDIRPTVASTLLNYLPNEDTDFRNDVLMSVGNNVGQTCHTMKGIP
jgi:hypothetical protein